MAASVSALLLTAGLVGVSGLGMELSNTEYRKKVDGPAPGDIVQTRLELGTANYIAEMRKRALGNKQSILPIPWDIIEERDVGYVGALPLLEEAAAEAVEDTLITMRETQGLNPQVKIVSVRITNSDQPAAPPSYVRMGKKGGKEILHLTGVVDPPSQLTELQWQKIRWAALKGWLENVTERRGSQMVIVTSYGDVLHGGCAENIMLHKYHEIIAASGGIQKIVVAAEVSPWPWDLGWRYSKTSWTTDRMAKVTSDLGIASDWASEYIDCNDTAAGPCGSLPKYQFANGGLIMGPAEDVYEMLSSLSSYGGLENRLVNEYYLKHPEQVTLDYAGTLFLSLHNLAKGGVTPVQVQPQNDTKVLYNKVTGNKVCFVHGNGNGFAALQEIAAQQEPPVFMEDSTNATNARSPRFF